MASTVGSATLGHIVLQTKDENGRVTKTESTSVWVLPPTTHKDGQESAPQCGQPERTLTEQSGGENDGWDVHTVYNEASAGQPMTVTHGGSGGIPIPPGGSSTSFAGQHFVGDWTMILLSPGFPPCPPINPKTKVAKMGTVELELGFDLVCRPA